MPANNSNKAYVYVKISPTIKTKENDFIDVDWSFLRDNNKEGSELINKLIEKVKNQVWFWHIIESSVLIKIYHNKDFIFNAYSK